MRSTIPSALAPALGHPAICGSEVKSPRSDIDMALVCTVWRSCCTLTGLGPSRVLELLEAECPTVPPSPCLLHLGRAGSTGRPPPPAGEGHR